MSSPERVAGFGGTRAQRPLFRSEALLARAQPANPPDRLHKELRGRRWPVLAMLAFIAVDIVFALSFHIPTFVNGPAMPGAAGRVLAVFPDTGGPALRPDQTATLTGPQGAAVPLRVVSVRRISTEAERDSIGLPTGVTVPFLIAELAGDPAEPAGERAAGQVRVRVAEHSLLETLTGLGGEER